MARILLLFAHPALEKSRVHKQLLRHIPQQENIRLHDLYELYPDFLIDIEKEQQLLLQYDCIVLQHPFYWYGVPAILKQWMDLVLEHGWAYGAGGQALRGKTLFNAISCGASSSAYSSEGRHGRTLDEFLVPFHQTARLCHMEYGDPFVVFGTHNLQETEIREEAIKFRNWLLTLSQTV